MASNYGQLVATRRAFMRLCRKRDSEGTVMDARHVSAVAPLWLDPASPLLGRVAHWAVLLAPAALVAINLWMIWRAQALTGLLPDDAAIPPVVFVGLYVAAVALCLTSLVQIARSTREPPETDQGT